MDTRDIFYVIKSKGYFKYAWKCCLFSDSNYLSDKYTPKIVTKYIMTISRFAI